MYSNNYRSVLEFFLFFGVRFILTGRTVFFRRKKPLRAGARRRVVLGGYFLFFISFFLMVFTPIRMGTVQSRLRHDWFIYLFIYFFCCPLKVIAAECRKNAIGKRNPTGGHNWYFDRLNRKQIRSCVPMIH